MSNQLYVIYGEDMARMTEQLLSAADLAGRIPAGAKIGIKPNLVVAKPASNGATTHVEIVEAIADYLLRHGFSDLCVLEGAWVGDSTKRAFEVCGYNEFSRRTGIPVYDTKGDETAAMTAGGITMEISKRALALDYLINVPVLKGHCQTMVTGALKNLKGCISDREKRHFHTLGLHKPIAYLSKLLRTSFTVVDGICGDLDFEEGGNPVRMNRMICGDDAVLVDSYIASCMGYAPEEIEYIRLAAQIGVGSCDLENAKINELNRDETPARPSPSRKVQRLAVHADARDACSACYANLIQAFARLDEEGALSRLPGKVAIGQGWRGKSGACGVGGCTGCMERSVGGCPPKTPEILRFLRELAR